MTQPPEKQSLGRTDGAPYRGYGYVPLRFGGNIVRRMGTQQQIKRRGMKPTTRTRTRAQNPLPEYFEVAVAVQTTTYSSLFEL